jgi:phage baseplate assembly protein W
MQIDIPVGQPINFNPATVEEEVLQNVAIILATPHGTAMMNRALGVSGALLDRPIDAAQAAAIADITEVVQTWEPRARVVAVAKGGDAAAGVLQPIVRIEINA